MHTNKHSVECNKVILSVKNVLFFLQFSFFSIKGGEDKFLNKFTRFSGTKDANAMSNCIKVAKEKKTYRTAFRDHHPVINQMPCVLKKCYGHLNR